LTGIHIWKGLAVSDLQGQFIELNQAWEQATPQTILRYAVDRYRERLALVTSFQPAGLVMLHMLLDIAPRIAILTLDTGLLFPETYALLARWEQDYNLVVTRVRPAQTVAQQAATHGTALWERNPDLCCHLRKTIPLGEALRGYDAWITGIRRDQSETRRNAAIIAYDPQYDNIKLAPLATWTEEMIWTYIHAHELPYNPLHDRQYPSIGCQPCTRPVSPGEDARSGRWSGQAKTECGIHVSNITTPPEEKKA
jgi:phosphoadenosine phosphosulfate reductase